MSGTARPRDVAAITGAIAGLLLWALHFALVYAASAIACERGLAGTEWFGLPALTLLMLGMTALALVAVAVVGWRAWRRLDGRMAGEEGDDMGRFTAWIAAGSALLAALAILWEGVVPVLILSDPCT